MNRLFRLFALLACWGLGLLAGQARAEHIYVVDPLNQAFNMSMLPTVLSFQGVCNKTAPRVYVVRYGHELEYLDYLAAQYGWTYEILPHVTDVFDVPELRALCSKLVVYDKDDNGLCLNVACTYAGLYDLALVEEDFLATMTAKGFTIQTDLRNTFNGQTAEQTQAWAKNNLRSLCANDITAISRGELGGTNYGVDYYVMRKMFVWCIDSTALYIGDYATTQKAIMGGYASMTPAFGHWSEEVGDVHALSEYGLCVVGGGPNVSLFHHVAVTGPLTQTSALIPFYNASKTYINISFTQGDGMIYCQRENKDFLTATSVTDPTKKVSDRYSYGLQQSASQWICQPVVPKYLYTLKNNKQFFSGKGFGYTNATELYNHGHLDAWIAKTRTYMDGIGHPDLKVNDADTEADANHTVLKYICQNLQPRAIWLKHQLHPASAEDDPAEIFYGKPVFGDPVFDREDANGNLLLNDTVNAIASSAGKRAFFWVYMTHRMDALELERLMDNLAANQPNIQCLNSDQLVRLFNREKNNLQGYWKLDESSGVSATDSSGNANTATLYNGPVWQPSGGRITGGLSFDGVNDYASTADGSSLSMSGDYTLSVWLKADATQKASAGIVVRTDSAGSTNHYGLTFDASADKKVLVRHQTSTWDTGIRLSQLAGAWHHIAVRRANNWMYAYLDNVQTAAASWTVAPGSGTGKLRLGCDKSASSSYVFKGQLDQVRIYKRTLPVGEIYDLFTEAR